MTETLVKDDKYCPKCGEALKPNETWFGHWWHHCSENPFA